MAGMTSKKSSKIAGPRKTATESTDHFSASRKIDEMISDLGNWHRPSGSEKSRGAASTRPPKGSSVSGLRVRVLTRTALVDQTPGNVSAHVAEGAGYYG